jgi:hypothetical protein
LIIFTASPQLNPCENPAWYVFGNVNINSPYFYSVRYTGIPFLIAVSGESIKFKWNNTSGFFLNIYG